MMKIKTSLLFLIILSIGIVTCSHRVEALKLEAYEPIIVDSPVKVTMTIDKLIVTLTLKNASSQDIILKTQDLGGNFIKKALFFFDSEDNIDSQFPYLTFKEKNNALPEEEFITLQPNEQISVNTDLRMYYNFDEKRYETLKIKYYTTSYVYNTEFEKIFESNSDGTKEDIIFHLESENIITLSYVDDISPYIKKTKIKNYSIAFFKLLLIIISFISLVKFTGKKYSRLYYGLMIVMQNICFISGSIGLILLKIGYDLMHKQTIMLLLSFSLCSFIVSFYYQKKRKNIKVFFLNILVSIFLLIAILLVILTPIYLKRKLSSL